MISADISFKKSNPFTSPDPNEVMAEMGERIISYYNYLVATGLLGLWRKSYKQYFSGVFRGGIINRAGERGEIADMTTNDFRNILQHILVMTTSSKVKWDAKATNSDYSSQAQAILVPGLLDYYSDKGGMTTVAQKTKEFDLLYGNGFILTDWDETKGKILAPHPDDMEAAMNGTLRRPARVQSEGDLTYSAKAPIDVVINPTLRYPEECNWYIVRTYKNTEDMVSLYPEHEAAIRSSTLIYDPRREVEDLFSIRGRLGKDPNVCVLWTLYHSPTPSLPQGRIAIMTGEQNALLKDEPLPFGRIPITRMMTSYIERTPFGYSTMWDVLPMQQARDITLRTMVTNVANTGIVNILTPNGSDIDVRQLVGGMNIISHQPGLEPKPLVLEATSASTFTLDGLLNKLIETNSGINSVQRGNPDSSLKAGVSLALVQAMAVQYNSAQQMSYVQALQKVGMDTIDYLKVKVPADREVAIVGKTRGQFIGQFKGEDLQGIDRVVADIGNPMTSTISGRASIAETLLQAQLINKEEYFQVINAGVLDPVMDTEVSENMLIKSENERLMQGKMVDVVDIDIHPRHIRDHRIVLNDPIARSNPEVIKAVTDHLQNHIQIWGNETTSNPALLAALNIPPMPMPAAPPPPPDGSGGPQGPPPDASAPTAPSPETSPQGPPQIAGKQFPKNPMTGQKWSPQNGGM